MRPCADAQQASAMLARQQELSGPSCLFSAFAAAVSLNVQQRSVFAGFWQAAMVAGRPQSTRRRRDVLQEADGKPLDRNPSGALGIGQSLWLVTALAALACAGFFGAHAAVTGGIIAMVSATPRERNFPDPPQSSMPAILVLEQHFGNSGQAETKLSRVTAAEASEH